MHILVGIISLIGLLFMLIRYPLTAVFAFLFPVIGVAIVTLLGGSEGANTLVVILGIPAGFLFGAALHQFAEE